MREGGGLGSDWPSCCPPPLYLLMSFKYHRELSIICIMLFICKKRFGLFLVNGMQTPLPHPLSKLINWVFGPKRCAIFWNVCINNFQIYFSIFRHIFRSPSFIREILKRLLFVLKYTQTFPCVCVYTIFVFGFVGFPLCRYTLLFLQRRT